MQKGIKNMEYNDFNIKVVYNWDYSTRYADVKISYDGKVERNKDFLRTWDKLTWIKEPYKWDINKNTIHIIARKDMATYLVDKISDYIILSNRREKIYNFSDKQKKTYIGV